MRRVVRTKRNEAAKIRAATQRRFDALADSSAMRLGALLRAGPRCYLRRVTLS